MSVNKENTSVIFGINGPVVTVKGYTEFSMQEMVYVGNSKLVGEVIRITDTLATIQVYEETTGLAPGEPIKGTGSPVSVLLGPGILGNIFDGIQRPLKKVEDMTGAFINRGISVSSLDLEKLWDVEMQICVGDTAFQGKIFATCFETELIVHKSMVPVNISGKVTSVVKNGKYTIDTTLATVQSDNGEVFNLTLMQKWPIKVPRPFTKRNPIDKPLITGQRIIDSVFPIAKGGCAAIPGGFGTGKTMTQHQLAKWCDADIIVYVGCGERGNEMTQVLTEFSELIDPKSLRPLSDRTVLIANTSNMPVAAREASIYTGITIGEYYRDMGYHVAIMADSTSRWAEALREISGRLEEMPAEEGFPAYLSSRLSQFYERAGYMDTLSGNQGSVTIIGAVSPQGGDFSEPVTQNTKRFIRCFWALDRQLAYSRHFPAINWTTSYSEYLTELSDWYAKNVGEDYLGLRDKILNILFEEDKLMEIVKLIGSDVLPDDQKLVLEAAKLVRTGFLQQNAFHNIDTYVPMDKQRKMMEIIIYAYDACKALVSLNIPMSKITNIGVFDKLVKMKYDIPNDDLDKFQIFYDELNRQIDEIKSENLLKTNEN